MCEDGHRVCLGYVKELVFLPYKSAPASAFSTNSALSREPNDNSLKSEASSSSTTYHSQRMAGIITPQSTKPSRSHPRPHIKWPVNAEAEVALALRRVSPFKGGEYNSFIASESIECDFSLPDQEECDDEFDIIMLPSVDALLRSGRQDPFRQYPIPSVGKYVDLLIDYG
jgi:hypothetical protein